MHLLFVPLFHHKQSSIIFFSLQFTKWIFNENASVFISFHFYCLSLSLFMWTRLLFFCLFYTHFPQWFRAAKLYNFILKLTVIVFIWECSFVFISLIFFAYTFWIRDESIFVFAPLSFCMQFLTFRILHFICCCHITSSFRMSRFFFRFHAISIDNCIWMHS